MTPTASRRLVHELDGRRHEVVVEGDAEWGRESVLLAEGDDLIRGCGWAADGYVVAPFLPPGVARDFVDGMTALVRQLMAEASVPTDGAFALEKYHQYAATDEQHARVVARFRKCLPIERFPMHPELVCDRISEICHTPLEVGSLQGTKLFCLRIIRPRSKDHNPLHRDAWFEHLRACVNIYAPLGGSTARSSMGVVPGSHLWLESDVCRTRSGGIVEGHGFTVPAVAASRRPIAIVRPNPGPEDVLVFSPFMIHGGAPNLEADLTRVSLELRFVRKSVRTSSLDFS